MKVERINIRTALGSPETFAQAWREALQKAKDFKHHVGTIDEAEYETKFADCTVHISGISEQAASEEKVVEYCSKFGTVLQATVRNRSEAEGKSWALVTFAEPRVAKKVLEQGYIGEGAWRTLQCPNS